MRQFYYTIGEYAFYRGLLPLGIDRSMSFPLLSSLFPVVNTIGVETESGSQVIQLLNRSGFLTSRFRDAYPIGKPLEQRSQEDSTVVANGIVTSIELSREVINIEYTRL